MIFNWLKILKKNIDNAYSLNPLQFINRDELEKMLLIDLVHYI